MPWRPRTHGSTAKRPRENRPSANARGYDYQWQQFRASYLREHPLCVDCEGQQLVRPATDVHHKQKLRDRPELKYETENLMALCDGCHKARTARGE